LEICVTTNADGSIADNNPAISKQTLINELPSSEYLLIALSRKIPGDIFGTFSIKKTNRIEVNQYLIIGNGKYQVLGCGLHTGDAMGGHYKYIDYIIRYTFNDVRHYPITPEEMEQINTDAYMFLYQKIAQATDDEIRRSLEVPIVARHPGFFGLSAGHSIHPAGGHLIHPAGGHLIHPAGGHSIHPAAGGHPGDIYSPHLHRINIIIAGLRSQTYITGDTIDLIQEALALYVHLHEHEKRQIGAFIPLEAIEIIINADIEIPENLILDSYNNKYLKYKQKYLQLKNNNKL
jgi:hypothetical protein